MLKYSISQAKETDLPDIVQLLLHIWKEQYQDFLPSTFLDKMDANRQLYRHQTYFDQKATYLIVKNEHKDLVAFCSFGKNRESFPLAKWELYTLYVHPADQGKGIGGRLIKEAQNQIKEGEEIAVWVMKANPFRHFYDKGGFKLVGERMVDFGEFEIEHLVMTLSKEGK